MSSKTLLGLASCHLHQRSVRPVLTAHRPGADPGEVTGDPYRVEIVLRPRQPADQADDVVADHIRGQFLGDRRGELGDHREGGARFRFGEGDAAVAAQPVAHSVDDDHLAVQ